MSKVTLLGVIVDDPDPVFTWITEHLAEWVVRKMAYKTVIGWPVKSRWMVRRPRLLSLRDGRTTFGKLRPRVASQRGEPAELVQIRRNNANSSSTDTVPNDLALRWVLVGSIHAGSNRYR